MENKKFLEGEVVCVSGKFDNLTQEEMESLVTKNGGTVSSSVTKKTTMLVTGDKVGATKLAKATELGIRIVDQNMFFLCLDDDSADNVSDEKEMSASVSSNKHSISMSFHCPYLDFWGLSLHKKEDLQAFVKEYSEEDVVDLDDPDFYIENVSEFFDKYGYPDSYNIFNELDEIWVSIDGERRTNYTESYKNGLDSGAIKVQESTTKLQTNGADYCCKSNLGNKTVMFEV